MNHTYDEDGYIKHPNPSELYYSHGIIHCIKEGKLIEEDVYRLEQDHPLRISYIDISQSSKRLKDVRYKKIYHLLLNRYTQNEIANEMKLTEGRVSQLIQEMGAELEYILNSGKTPPIQARE